MGLKMAMPALFTSASNRPKCAAAWRTAAVIAAGAETSQMISKVFEGSASAAMVSRN
jgi:hypothetical protein